MPVPIFQQAVSDPGLPYWVPTGENWQNLPDGVKRAVSQVLAPAYRRFVLDVAGEIERSIGLTLVHFMWLEVCAQVNLAEAAANPGSLTAVLGDPNQMMDRYMNLATAKCQTAEFLVKLRLVGDAMKRSTVIALPAPPPADDPDAILLPPVIPHDGSHVGDCPNFRVSENGTVPFGPAN